MKIRRRNASRQSGQTLVALLAFMAMAIILTSAATTVTILNTQASSTYTMGQQALRYAEAGVDNAMMRLLREPGYTGETLSFANGTATITVSGDSAKTIVSEGATGSFKRTVQVTATSANNTLILNSWSEIP